MLGADDSLPTMGYGEMKKYPHLFPPDGFYQFDRIGLFITPAAGSGILVTLTPPGGYLGWVRLLGLEATNFGKVYYTILRGGAPIEDYTRITVPVGSTTTPKPVFIKLEPNRPLQLQATWTDPTLGLRFLMWGWFYPEKS